MTKKSILFTSLLLFIPLFAGADREFVFDIHDAASSTEQYANEAVIVPVYQTDTVDVMLSDDFAGILPDFYNTLPALLQASDFKATAHTCALFSDTDNAGNTFTIIASSLGSTAHAPCSLEVFRRCIARALCEAEKHNIQTVHIAIPTCVNGTMKEITQEIAAITHAALYTPIKTNKPSYNVKRVCVHAHMHTPNDFKDVNIGLRIGANLGTALCQARDWINTSAKCMTPTILANHSAQYLLPYIAKIETIIFEPTDITRMGMGGLLGATQGSDQPGALVVHYLKCRYPDVPTIALIGNGIIDDTHRTCVGIAGAAAAFAALNVITYRNVPANIVVLTPLVKRAHTDAALKMGALLTLSNHHTVEVTDTDAIAELMLADAITHAITHYHPDYIIDIATLTDACKQTFGGTYAAIMSNNETLIKHAYHSGVHTGELAWQLPLHHAYTARLHSQNATLCNACATNRTAKTQVAGCFLQHFVRNTPWLHIDIAGAKTAQEYSAQGCPSFGVRLLVDLVESLAKKVQ